MDSLRIKRLEDAVIELATIISNISLDSYILNSELFAEDGYKESCQRCGSMQELIWTASGELWEKVTNTLDGSGVFCPNCFNELANEKGIFIRWIPTEENLVKGQ